PLPEKVAPIRIDDYLPAAYRQLHRLPPGLDDSTMAGNIARARSIRYRTRDDFARAIYWEQQGLAAVPPLTNDAQQRRMDLAVLYHLAGDLPHALAACREVIRIGQAQPEGWSPAARRMWHRFPRGAQAEMEYLSHPRRPRR